MKRIYPLTQIAWIAYQVLLFSFLITISSSTNAQTPVEKHGQLRVQGNKIVDKNGNPVQLKGMSLYWSMWKPAFYNEATVKWLRDDWCITVIRAAIGIDAGNGGYLYNPTAEMNRITTVVDAAIKHGIYVIVDFHDHTASDKLATAKKFFQDVSAKYKNVPNILYETWNEPLAVSWSSVIKPYHQQIVTTIRQNDPDNIIICGTANWSQKVEDPANDPVQGSNIAYTLHYYAASHKQWLRDATSRALGKGIALFVTEYGTSEASGNGILDAVESKTWWDFLEKNSIGHCNWSAADLGETSAALKTGTSANGNWPASALKPSGILVRDYLKSKCDKVVSSLEAEEHLSGINCFPNPFTENLTLEAKGDFTYSVFDLTGKEHEKGKGNSLAIIGERLPSGIYLLNLSAANGSRMMKITKQ